MKQSRVLVVEDDPDNRKIITRVLELEGYAVVEATDGEGAIAAARRERPDLIIMDLALPGTDGWEATRRLKADPELARIPVVALSAYAMKGDEESALAAGCDHYLAKPCPPALIREVVAKFLGRGGKVA